MAVIKIALQHPSLRILNLNKTLRIDAIEAKIILAYCSSLLVLGVTPAHIVGEKAQWISILTDYKSLAFEEVCMDLFVNAGVPYELIQHTFWLEE